MQAPAPLAAEATPITVRPLSSQASALACQPHETERFCSTSEMRLSETPNAFIQHQNRPVGSCFKLVRPGGVVMGVVKANLYYTIIFQS